MDSPKYFPDESLNQSSRHNPRNTRRSGTSAVASNGLTVASRSDHMNVQHIQSPLVKLEDADASHTLVKLEDISTSGRVKLEDTDTSGGVYEADSNKFIDPLTDNTAESEMNQYDIDTYVERLVKAPRTGQWQGTITEARYIAMEIASERLSYRHIEKGPGYDFGLPATEADRDVLRRQMFYAIQDFTNIVENPTNYKVHRVRSLSDFEVELICWRILDQVIVTHKGQVNIPRWQNDWKWEEFSCFQERWNHVLDVYRRTKSKVWDVIASPMLERIAAGPKYELDVSIANV